MKKYLGIALAMAMTLSLAACGGKTPSTDSTSNNDAPSFVISEDPVVVSVEDDAKEEVEEEVIPPNSYRSELTNEWISNDIKDQRPLAVMIDNESVALPHYGTSAADIVYEMVNSTANNRITRLMCIIKDWKSIDYIGSIRSTRPTNAMIFAEYNAILLHDGGPFYINDWLAHPNSRDHLSGGFARIDRGKAGFYEEYATVEHWKGEGEYSGQNWKSISERIDEAGFDTEYNSFYMGEHFKFANKEYDFDDDPAAVSAKLIKPNFPHNESTLTYDEKKGVYVYSEYGEEYVDALLDSHLEFKNVILYSTLMVEYDSNGYMAYNAIGHADYGYFCTNGKAIPISWTKDDQDSLTKFNRLDNGEEIELNTGKTYIAICPIDDFERTLVLE